MTKKKTAKRKVQRKNLDPTKMALCISFVGMEVEGLDYFSLVGYMQDALVGSEIVDFISLLVRESELSGKESMRLLEELRLHLDQSAQVKQSEKIARLVLKQLRKKFDQMEDMWGNDPEAFDRFEKDVRHLIWEQMTK